MAKVGRAAHTASRNRLEVVTASKTLTLAESGEIYGLSLSGVVTITLPSAPENGTNYTFVIADQGGAHDVVIDTGSNARYFLGGVVHFDTNADNVSVSGDKNSNSKLTLVDPDEGTRIHCVSNGTLWLLSGGVVSATVPSFADQ